MFFWYFGKIVGNFSYVYGMGNCNANLMTIWICYGMTVLMCIHDSLDMYVEWQFV